MKKKVVDYNKEIAKMFGFHENEYGKIHTPIVEAEWICKLINKTYRDDREIFPHLEIWDYVAFDGDRNWEWLMTAVDFIDKILYVNNCKFSVMINGNICSIGDIIIVGSNKRDAVFKAVSQFAKRENDILESLKDK